MHIIYGNTINEIALKSWNLIFETGNTSTNRNAASLGGINVAYDVSILMENPRSRHLYLNGRKNNIFAVFGEMFWVMAGREDTEYLMNFIPRANDFSDDGKTWRAAYGSRWYEYGQLQNLVDKFVDDGLYTRQAMLTLWHPEKDTKEMLQEKYGLEKTKDTPCNQWLQFWVEAGTNELNMKVIQRSGDAIWGTLNINLPEFSFLHEFVYQMVKQTYPEVKLGKYHHSVTNFHIYEATAQQAKDAVDTYKYYAMSNFTENVKPAVFPTSVTKMKQFFNNICEIVVDENPNASDRIRNIFNFFEVPMEDNIVYDYVIFTRAWMASKRAGYKNATKEENEISVPVFCKTSKDLIQAIENSPFRNFVIRDNGMTVNTMY